MSYKNRMITIAVALGIVGLIGADTLFMPKIIDHALAKETENVVKAAEATMPSTIQQLNIQPQNPSSTVTEHFDKTMTQEKIDQIGKYIVIVSEVMHQRLEHKYGSKSPIVRTEGDPKWYGHRALEGMYENWSEEQWQRYYILSDQYTYDGLRPKKPILWGVGNPDQAYFDYQNIFYHWPERELKDEDILQYIDFDECYMYVSRLKFSYLSKHKEWAQRTDVISQSDAEAKTEKVLASVFKVQTDDKDTNFEYYTYEEFPRYPDYPDPPVISVEISPFRSQTLWAKGIPHKRYFLQFELYSGEFYKVDVTDLNPKEEKPVPLGKDVKELQKDEQLLLIAETAAIRLASALSKAETVKTVKVVDDDLIVWKNVPGYIIKGSNSLYGTTDIVVEMEDGSAYCLNVYYADYSIQGIRYNKSVDAMWDNILHPVVRG